MWSHYTPLWYVAPQLGSGASPQLCWERDKQVPAFLPWGRSCLRSHLSAPAKAEAGLAQELSI